MICKRIVQIFFSISTQIARGGLYVFIYPDAFIHPAKISRCIMMLPCLYRFEARSKAIVLDLLEPRWVISSAPYRGGLLQSRYLVNYTAPHDFATDDVSEAIENKITTLGLPKEQTTCVMTAVNVDTYSYAQSNVEEVKARVYITVGLGNLSSPGYSSLASLEAGTINILALV